MKSLNSLIARFIASFKPFLFWRNQFSKQEKRRKYLIQISLLNTQALQVTKGDK
jgi:hypothetical protein